jgi:glucosylceramidase
VHLRFFEEYFKHGIKYWGVTIQNEPSSGADPGYGWQTLYFSYEMQRDFAAKLLGPLLRKTAVTQDIKLMGHDDQRTDVLKAAQAMYNVSKNESYIDGLAVHWYSHSQYEPLTDAHNIRPDKFILSTEACNAYAPGEHVPILGDWERGEAYGHDIIQNLANWVTGWTDWNLALDEKGGPNWVGNFVDAPVIVNKTADEFYKQPMFYYLGHFR